MALRMSSEETATAQMLWAGEITAECYGPRWSGNPKRVRNGLVARPSKTRGLAVVRFEGEERALLAFEAHLRAVSDRFDG